MQSLTKKLILSAVMVGFAGTAISAGEVYRWEDSNGRLSFSDRPMDRSAKPYSPTHGVMDENAPDPIALRRQQQCETAKRHLDEVYVLVEHQEKQGKTDGTFNEAQHTGRSNALIAEASHSVKVWCRKANGSSG